MKPLRWSFSIHKVLALAFIAPAAAQALEASACYTISNADQRAWCLAKARGESSMCYTIQDQVTRAQCIAEVRK